jgi:hypothetical protein
MAIGSGGRPRLSNGNPVQQVEEIQVTSQESTHSTEVRLGLLSVEDGSLPPASMPSPITRQSSGVFSLSLSCFLLF